MDLWDSNKAIGIGEFSICGGGRLGRFYSKFNKHTVHSLYRIQDMTISVIVVMKLKNIVPGAGTEPTRLPYLTTMLSGHLGSLSTITLSMPI